MNKLGEHIPTAWIWLIPFFGGIWWVWKYSEAVGHVTKDKLGGIFAFLLIFFLGSIGHAIIQDFFNKIGASPAESSTVPAQPAPATPAEHPTSATASANQAVSETSTTPAAETPTSQTPPADNK